MSHTGLSQQSMILVSVWISQNSVFMQTDTLTAKDFSDSVHFNYLFVSSQQYIEHKLQIQEHLSNKKGEFKLSSKLSCPKRQNPNV